MSTLPPLTDRAGPGRPREFDLDDALRDATEVFRRRGYHGTSVQDLTEGTGLARGSLYKAFHDKRTLFLAALEQAVAGAVQRLADALDAPGPAKLAIRETLMGYARRAASVEGRAGCIMTSAAIEMMPEDADVSTIITAMFRRIETLFAAAIERGQAEGEIPPGHDARAIALQMLCTIQGLRILGKTGPSEQASAAIVAQAIRSLD